MKFRSSLKIACCIEYGGTVSKPFLVAHDELKGLAKSGEKKTEFPAELEASALSQKGAFGRNRPGFPVARERSNRMRKGLIMNIDRVHGVFMRRFRPRRMKAMAQNFGMTKETTVLDVGGSMFNWNLLPFCPRLTILNLGPRPQHLPAQIKYVQGDALNLPFNDNCFDLVFSNSVIEHVGGWDDQARMANEIRRVGTSYYVQTPNYWFPVEPHLITPLIHWLPIEVQQKLIRNFTVWGLLTRPSRVICEQFIESTRLLTKHEMALLFTEAEWMNERVIGLDKSIIAVFRGRTTNPF